MEIEAAYPIVVTTRLVGCRDFCARHLGFQLVVVQQTEPALGSRDKYVQPR